jgi:hypothetical protein
MVVTNKIPSDSPFPASTSAADAAAGPSTNAARPLLQSHERSFSLGSAVSPREGLDNQNNLDGRTKSRAPSIASFSDTASHFTSISQRGVNPRWRPRSVHSRENSGPPHSRAYPPSSSRFAQRASGVPKTSPSRNRNDILLQGNPDFALPPSLTAAAGLAAPSTRGRGGWSRP